MSVREVEVRLGREGRIRIASMRHPPRVGKPLIVEGEEWLVLAVSYEIPFRTERLSFVVPNQQQSA